MGQGDTGASINEGMDWIFIRQCLALSLASKRPLLLEGAGEYLARNPLFLPIIDDLKTLMPEGRRRLAIEKGALAFDPPELSSGVLTLHTGDFSAAVEVLHFLMPCFFRGDFRSVVHVSGVTQSPLSQSPGALRDGLLPFLEDLGFCQGLVLGRYGFYGSGGGRLEARIYPGEERGGAGKAECRGIAGARIITSRIPQDFMSKTRERIACITGIDPQRIQHLEVMDSDGGGLGIEIMLDFSGRSISVSHDARFFDVSGEFSLDEERIFSEISVFLEDVRRSAEDGSEPGIIARELIPYRIIAGTMTCRNLGEFAGYADYLSNLV